MKLDQIGFYTLSEQRCSTASVDSPIVRGEIVLTAACNFKCPYCREQRSDLRKHLSLQKAKDIVTTLSEHGLINLRLSGGEPTIWSGLTDLVSYAKSLDIKRIAISTNGSASQGLYSELIDAGVNDFSVSLDACCSSTGDTMSGKCGAWPRVVENIQYLSSLVYTTVGIVVTTENIKELPQTVEFAASLGVSDIRVISAAQYQSTVDALAKIPEDICSKFPILKYRVNNAAQSVGVRGIGVKDSHHCWIAIDDVAIAGENHFPCIIYFREGGNPIGKISSNLRQDRARWIASHNTHKDPICKANCLDCIVKYNNRFEDIRHEHIRKANGYVRETSAGTNSECMVSG